MTRKLQASFEVSARGAKIFLMAIALLASFFATNIAQAQVLYGSLTGTVTDPTGAVIPNIVVTVTEQGTGASRPVKANGQGDYEILDMLPGVYTISVAKTGNFGAFQVRGVQMEVNRAVRVDIKLQPATVSTQVTVTEAAPELQTETAEVDSEIGQTQLAQLPITSSQGRNYESLYTLIPGAADVRENNSIGGNPSRAMMVNINGNSANGNTTRVDGAIDYYGWLPYLIAYVTPTDAVENVSVTTDDFNAEQG